MSAPQAGKKLVRKVDSSVLIAGVEFPVKSWNATLASAGSMGTASATGALSDLEYSGLRIVQASQDAEGAPFDIYCGYDGNEKLLFSGVCDKLHFDWDADTFTVKGRDHSAVLADGKQTVVGLEYRNQTVARIVQQIADKFGLQAQVTDPGVMAGPLVNGENSFNPQPQTYWNLLQTLAENCGYECYMKPDQTLYFGPDQPQGTIEVNYGAQPGSGAKNPGWGLEVEYDPRNNSNVVVKVLSVDPLSLQKINATATANQQKLGKGRKSFGAFTPKRPTYPSKSGSGNKTSAKSIHYIRRAGLTPDQAALLAQATADNLAKHQIVMSMSIEGNTDVEIHSNINLVETEIDLYGFAGVDFNVKEVTHSYSVPSDGATSGGYETSFRATGRVEGN